MNFDLNKTLQELENSDWGNPQSDSPLEKKCLQLRQIPLNEFKADDLVRMILQNIGIEYLVPLAMERLRADPLADRDFYPGCLLRAILEVSYQFWKKHPDLREEVEIMYNKLFVNESNEEDLTKDVIRDLKKSHLTFTEFGYYRDLIWKDQRVKQTCSGYAIKILAVIASRQPIVLEDLNAVIPAPLSDKGLQMFLKNPFITYDYEGTYPAPRFFRLSKAFRKKLGL